MNERCTAFHAKHIPEDSGKWGPPYANPKYHGTDGMGVFHYRLEVPCKRCGKPYTVAMLSTAKDIQS